METTFHDLGLSPDLLKSLDEAGYKHPTPIQAKAIPAILMMRDVMGCAQTGTGKTAGFTLPMIDVLAEGKSRAKMPRALILSPTRELAAQISENFAKYTANHSLKFALLIGGESMRDQEEILGKGVDVLIATPGRMLDLFERGAIILNDVKMFVIDEADRMLDMGFIPNIETIVSKLPATRQTLMFSATMPPEIRKLAEKFLDNPKEISVAPQGSTASTVTHKILYCGVKQKRENLRAQLVQEPPESAIIFCNRKRDIGVLVRSLKRHGYNAGELHGDLAQSVRMETLDKFKAGEINLLVCSDVAARGIDVASVSHVFNFDVPHHPEDYVHRIGRTGRAGRDGNAVMFATSDDDKSVAAIEAIIGKKIDVVEGFDKAAPDKAASASEQKPSRRRGSGSGSGNVSGTARSSLGSPSAGGSSSSGPTPSGTSDGGGKSPSNGRTNRGASGRRNGGTGNDDVPTHTPVPVNMAAWTDFVEQDVTRAAQVFEGMIPAFLLRHKNAVPIKPADESMEAELDIEAVTAEAAKETASETEAEAQTNAETDAGAKKAKPKRKRAPRKRKPKAETAPADTAINADTSETSPESTSEISENGNNGDNGNNGGSTLEVQKPEAVATDTKSAQTSDAGDAHAEQSDSVAQVVAPSAKAADDTAQIVTEAVAPSDDLSQEVPKRENPE